MLQYSVASAAEDADVVDDDGRSSSSLRCDYCLLTAYRDGRPREELLVCFCCMAKAHPSCMDYSDELAARTRRSPWQCIDCKTCSVCGDPGDADAMLFCDACDKGYHMACHDPRIPEKPNGKWICRRCQEDQVDQQPAVACHPSFCNTDHTGLHSSCRCTVDGTPGLPTPCHSPILDAVHHGSSQVVGMSISDGGRNVSMLLLDVPDASDWSIEDIEKYFASIGFPEDAKAFREQEIDGRSLLLLKRNDVLSGLGLKLGPALKIYSHVRRLQMKHEMMTTQQSFKG